jgi:capsule polysaccharide export protein KpsC/LpsZ
MNTGLNKGDVADDHDRAAPDWWGERLIVVAFSPWRQRNMGALLRAASPLGLHFAPTAAAAAALHPTAADALLFWGATPPGGVAELAQRSGAKMVHIEDGFLRSVGLGSDMIPPRSLALDARGLYFDPSRPSTLEHLLNTAVFGADELAVAARLRAFIVEHGLTKYNHEPREAARWTHGGRRVVPGLPGCVHRLQAPPRCDQRQPRRGHGIGRGAAMGRPCGNPAQRGELHRGLRRAAHDDVAGRV